MSKNLRERRSHKQPTKEHQTNKIIQVNFIPIASDSRSDGIAASFSVEIPLKAAEPSIHVTAESLAGPQRLGRTGSYSDNSTSPSNASSSSRNTRPPKQQSRPYLTVDDTQDAEMSHKSQPPHQQTQPGGATSPAHSGVTNPAVEYSLDVNRSP